MPLNPPSYLGQDVWYSPNVYINKVPAALWKPPIIGQSLIFQFTLPPDQNIPDPGAAVNNALAQTLTQNQANQYNKGAEVVGGSNVGSKVDVVVPDAPAPGATIDNLDGDPKIAASPLELPPGAGPWKTLNANLDATLAESQAGQWPNRQSANVKACFAELGRLDSYPNAWCAAYAGTMLKRSGITYLQNELKAFNFRNKKWGKPVSLNDYSQWRYNDLVVFNFSHVAFVRGIDTSTMSIQVIGGNQHDSLTQINFGHGSLSQICYVARAWDLPPEFDKPITMKLTPGKKITANDVH